MNTQKLIDVVDVLRQIWPTTTKFASQIESQALTRIEIKPKFIHPKLRVIKPFEGGRIIIISAPGAVGKTTFAKYCTFDKKGYFWDLAKLKLGDNTFIGTLAKTFGSKNLSKVLDEFDAGNLAFFFDAFDEAEIISGWEGVENFIREICSYSATSSKPNIVFFSRSETASLLQLLLDEASGTDSYSMFEIDYFDKDGAIQFIQEYLKSNGDESYLQHPEPFNRAVHSIFSAVGHGMNGESDNIWNIDDIRSFIGYSPVLQTIGSFMHNQNYEEIANQFENKISTESGLRVISGFIEKLLTREQEKVVSALKERVTNIPKDWDNWKNIYHPIDQVASLVTYLLKNRRLDSIDYSSVPDWLKKDYIDAITNFLPNHPFLKAGEFSSPAFRDYSISMLLTKKNEYDGQCKALLDKGSFVLTSLFAYFYVKFSDNKCYGPHVGLIHEAVSAKKAIESTTLLTFIKPNNQGHHVLEIVNPEGLSSLNLELECLINNNHPVIFERRLQNAIIHCNGQVILGKSEGSIELSDIDIEAEKIVIKAKECILNTHNEGTITLKAKDILQEDYSLSLKRIGTGDIQISWPGGHAFPWTEYYVQSDYSEDLDFKDELYALKRILEPFRKHKKKGFAKQSEFIDNIIVKGNPLRRDLLNFLLKEGIMRKNSAANQYLVEEEKLNSSGINWLSLKSLSMDHNKQLTAFLRTFKETAQYA